MKKIYILAAATLALAACSNDDDSYVDEPVAAHISATIGGCDVTRAGDSSWGAGDEIGVTMVGRYANIKYKTVAGDGMFDGTTIYFRNKREPVNLTAYYPFTGDEGTAPAVMEINTGGENQTSEKQPTFDFLYAIKENVTGGNPEVKFDFFHRMSKLTLIFNNGNDGTDVRKIISYQIDGLVLDGTFDTNSGTCAVKSDAEVKPLIIELEEGTVKSGVAMSLILIPQLVTSEAVTLKIIDSDEQEYSCKLNFKDNILMAGNNYQWTITVKKTGLVIDKSTITDWATLPEATDAGSVLPQNGD